MPALILFVGAIPVALTLSVWSDVKSIEENIKQRTNGGGQTLEHFSGWRPNSEKVLLPQFIHCTGRKKRHATSDRLSNLAVFGCTNTSAELSLQPS